MNKGIHISFCGIGGSGKTTHAKILHNKLSKSMAIELKHGYHPSTNIDNLKKVAESREISKVYNDELVSMAYLLDLKVVDTNLQNELQSGKNILTERFWICSKIFSEALGVDQFFIDYYIKQAKVPDVVILLDVAPEIAYERIKRRNNGIENNDMIEVMSIARKSYLNKCKELNAIIVDTCDELSVVNDKIYECLSVRLRNQGYNIKI